MTLTFAYSTIITRTHGPHTRRLEESTMKSGSPVDESFRLSETKDGHCPADTMDYSSARESSCPPATHQPAQLYKDSSPTSTAMTPKFPNSYCPPSLRAKILSHTQPYPSFLKAHLEPDTRSRSVPPVRIRLRTADMSPTRSTKSDAAASFPSLKQLGWTPHHILGDGNCLFRALSHQLYGHDQLHSHVRSEVIAQFRQDKELLLPFMAEDLRRSTRTRGRQPAAAPSGPSATQDQIFEQRIALMKKNRTWGDHLEIQTFCNLKQCNVVIFNEGGSMPIIQPRGITDSSNLATYYLAYHQHEHYSSVRHRIQHVSLPKTLAAFDAERGVGPPAGTPALTMDNGSDDSTSTPVESESENMSSVPNKRKRSLQQFRSFEGSRSESARPFDEECKLKRIKLRVKEPQSEPVTIGSRMRPVEVD